MTNSLATKLSWRSYLPIPNCVRSNGSMSERKLSRSKRSRIEAQFFNIHAVNFPAKNMNAPKYLNRKPLRLFLGLFFISSFPCILAAEWHPAQGPLKTRWAADVSPQNAHPEYPRPQMVRSEWLNLNGLWDFAITEKNADKAVTFSTQ